jgi:hypothetical protein
LGLIRGWWRGLWRVWGMRRMSGFASREGDGYTRNVV